MRRAFAQVDAQFQSLIKIFQHNGQVIQTGFYRNDIWLECFKLILSDLALNAVRMTEGVSPELNWDSYWKTANETVNAQVQAVNEANAAKNREPEQPLVHREEGDVVEFGGDFNPEETEDATSEHAQAGEADAERHDHHQDERGEGNAADALP